MIIPITKESEWGFLTELQDWQPPLCRTVVISPHPDDETLGLGGFIAHQTALGSQVIVFAVTDGEKAYSDYPGLGALRQQEQENALAMLGVPASHIIRCCLPDTDIASFEHALLNKLLPLLSADTHLITPWIGDYHPDHEACGRVAATAARLSGARLSSYFFWTWHRGRPEVLQGLNLRRFPLTDHALLSKAEALLQHTSQLNHWSDEPPILPEDLLGPMARPYEVFLVS